MAAQRTGGMHRYIIRYAAPGASSEIAELFEAASAPAALLLIEEKAIGTPAILYQDGKELCRRGWGGAGFEKCWILSR
jgi:hypothetical protein